MMPSREEFAALVRKANDGDPAAIATMRQTLDNAPEIWRQIGDLGQHAESALLNLVAGGNQLSRESVARNLQRMRTELGEAKAGPLEKLAINRVVISWLQVQYADMLYGGTGKADAKRTTYVVRWLDQSARRHTAAIKALLDVRRLLSASGHGQGPPGRGRLQEPGLRVFKGEHDGSEQAATGT